MFPASGECLCCVTHQESGSISRHYETRECAQDLSRRSWSSRIGHVKWKQVRCAVTEPLIVLCHLFTATPSAFRWCTRLCPLLHEQHSRRLQHGRVTALRSFPDDAAIPRLQALSSPAITSGSELALLKSPDIVVHRLRHHLDCSRRLRAPTFPPAPQTVAGI